MTPEKARLALEEACANHERIAQAVRQSPDDYATRRSLVRAIGAGRAAWRWYQAAGACLEKPLADAVPEEFKA